MVYLSTMASTFGTSKLNLQKFLISFQLVHTKVKLRGMQGKYPEMVSSNQKGFLGFVTQLYSLEAKQQCAPSENIFQQFLKNTNWYLEIFLRDLL